MIAVVQSCTAHLLISSFYRTCILHHEANDRLVKAKVCLNVCVCVPRDACRYDAELLCTCREQNMSHFGKSNLSRK